jgi:hypothetical protein
LLGLSLTETRCRRYPAPDLLSSVNENSASLGQSLVPMRQDETVGRYFG